jgi:hypothetical protein
MMISYLTSFSFDTQIKNGHLQKIAVAIFGRVNMVNRTECDSFGKVGALPEYNSLSKASALKVNAALRKLFALSL